MSKAPSICLAVALLGIGAAARATEGPSVLVFSEPGFPAADSAPPTEAQLAKLLPEAERVRARQLASRLARLTTRLLVLPYGSAFPEASWPDIQRFLRRGGNLLVIGGRPFTRAELAVPIERLVS